MIKRIGGTTAVFPGRPVITAWGSVVGPKEGQGPLGEMFDVVLSDDMAGEESWEKAESKIVEQAVKIAIKHSGKNKEDMNYMLGGDLLNQIIAISFASRTIGIPFLGLYGACSSMGEAMSIASMLVDGGFAENIVCVASSHFSTAERQYRFPLEMGTSRPPTSQWTVTGAGSVVLSQSGNGPVITHATNGRVVDLGVTDINNMGAAMAPAAFETLRAHFMDTGRSPKDYDRIITGDLGRVGAEILKELMAKEGIPLLENRYMDCGLEIFSPEQNVHAGASGCGCSATTLCAKFLPLLMQGKLDRVLFMPTGALLSPTSSLQGESIPGIAHAIVVERPEGANKK